VVVEMHVQHVTPDIICYSSAISTCEKDGKWEQALNLLQLACVQAVELNDISYNAAISACSKGQQWMAALDLLTISRDARILSDTIGF
jgi:pentatricopeptide repeat domain-containing protein 1